VGRKRLADDAILPAAVIAYVDVDLGMCDIIWGLAEKDFGGDK
jgi:hypothetical protein